jgi:hypothetical protein
MTNVKGFFHALSYLQYPLIGVALVYYTLFMISLSIEPAWPQLNLALIFYGIAISFSTLQDTRKTQNKLSERVWKSPRKGKFFLGMMSLLSIIFMALGLAGMIYSQQKIHQDIALGLIVLGISLVGMLKAAIEMFENHRLDRVRSGETETG